MCFVSNVLLNQVNWTYGRSLSKTKTKACLYLDGIVTCITCQRSKSPQPQALTSSPMGHKAEALLKWAGPQITTGPITLDTPHLFRPYSPLKTNAIAGKIISSCQLSQVRAESELCYEKKFSAFSIMQLMAPLKNLVTDSVCAVLLVGCRSIT